MATWLDNDVYAKFRGSEDLAALSDTFHSAIDALEPQPDPGLAAHLGGGPAESAADGALPSPEPPSPPPQVAPQPVPPADAASTSTLPAPDAPVTAPLQPSSNGMLDRNGVIAYVHQQAQRHGLDPAAVLAVANQEGLNTAPGSHWQLGGESNISFGPPSWYGNGAGNAILAQHGKDAARWSWTPEGIDYWLGQVAQAASGLTGNDAVAAIVHKFERPREDLAAGEVSRAQSQYATFTQPGTGITYAGPQAAPAESGAQSPATTSASSGGLASGLQSLSDAFHQKIDELGSVAGQVKDTGASAIQQLATDFHQKINDLGAAAPVANEAVQQGILKYGPVAQTQNVIKALGSMGLLAGAENPNVSDQELANHAIMALSFGSEGGAKFDKYGVEQGFVPPSAKDITPPEPAAPAPVSKPIGDVWNTPAAMEPLPPRAAPPEPTPAVSSPAEATPIAPQATPPVAPPRDLPQPKTFDVNGNQLSGQVTTQGPTPAAARVQSGGTAGVPPAALPNAAGITPETMQAAYQRIEKALGTGTPEAEAAQQKLDQLIASGATPDAVARHMAEVAGQKVNMASVVRTVRTGSMAGGLTTEGKVALSPIIQTAMRAPVAAVKAIVTGKAGDIPTGLQGGLAGLAEGAADGLQTIRYGINYRAALTGAAEGGYGFKPGLDVLGKNTATRLAGTAAMGLVRSHGAVADLSAGIGRGAAKATGATPAAAAEVGQQWAFRSGNYGTVGKFVADQIGDLRRVNPAMDIASQIILPFYRVGYNVLTQGVERSPLGLVGTGIDVARGKLGSGPYRPRAANKAVTPAGDRLANNMFGVGLASLGLAQASAGNITGENPQGGAPRWSVRVAGAWLPLRTLGPAGEALAQSAALYEGVRDSRGDVAKMAQRSATEYAGHIFDESWLRSVTDALALVGDVAHMSSSYAPTALGSAKDFAYQGGKIAKSFIPQQKLGEQLLGAVQPASRAAPAPAGGGRRSAPVPLGRKPTPRR